MARYIDPFVSQGVNLGFATIMIVPLAVIMCISFFRARRSKDPARVTTTYFKIMLPIAILWLVMYLIQGTMSMVTNQYYLTSIRLYHAQLRTSALGALFSDITDLLMIMTLAEMGNGFLFCLTQTRTGLQRAVRIASIASCVILSLLAIARFGVSNAVYSQYISDSWYSYTNDTLDESRGKMAGAFSILTFVWALILLVFAAVVFNKTKRNYILKNSAVLFLVAAVLYFISHLYTLIYACIFVLSDYYLYRYSTYETWTALMFVDPVFSVWFYTAVVALVFTVVIRKRNGLWTTMQPWMDEQGPPALFGTPSAKGPGEQWQQPSNSHVVVV